VEGLRRPAPCVAATMDHHALRPSQNSACGRQCKHTLTPAGSTPNPSRFLTSPHSCRVWGHEKPLQECQWSLHERTKRRKCPLPTFLSRTRAPVHPMHDGPPHAVGGSAYLPVRIRQPLRPPVGWAPPSHWWREPAPPPCPAPRRLPAGPPSAPAHREPSSQSTTAYLRETCTQ